MDIDSKGALRLIRDGDLEFFWDLFAFYSPGVKQYVLNHLQDNDLADELTHHLFEKLYETAGRRLWGKRYNTIEELLLVMITGMVKDFVREREAQAKGTEELLKFPRPPQDRPDQKALQKELEAVVDDGIASLPPELGEAADLVILQENTPQEAAVITGVPLKTFETRYRRARMALRKRVNRYRHGGIR